MKSSWVDANVKQDGKCLYANQSLLFLHFHNLNIFMQSYTQKSLKCFCEIGCFFACFLKGKIKERSSILGLISQWLPQPGTSQIKVGRQELQYLPGEQQWPDTWAIFCCSPKFISRKLDRKYQNQRSNWLSFINGQVSLLCHNASLSKVPQN